MGLNITKAPVGEGEDVRIVLLGAPGSGKGTLVRPLSELFSLHALSTGDMLRRVAREDSELGRRVGELLEQGRFVPDGLVANVLRSFLRGLQSREYVLDGFPRNLTQAKILENVARPDCALLLQVADEVLTERSLGRLVCTSCSRSYHEKFQPPRQAMICDNCGEPLSKRNDDTPEVVRQRLQRYHQETEPLIGFYRANGVLHTISGVGTPSEVQQRACEILSEL